MTGRILREADERGLLGATLLVVGTGTMAAPVPLSEHEWLHYPMREAFVAGVRSPTLPRTTSASC